MEGCDSGENYDIYIGNSRKPYEPTEFLGLIGLIDEVMVYNRALSAGEVYLLYSKSLK